MAPPGGPEAAAAPGMSFPEREASAKLLIQAFGPERYTYLSLVAISTVMLLGSAGFVIVSEKANPATLTSLFGSSGVIAFSLTQVLKLWNRTAAILMGTWSREDQT